MMMKMFRRVLLLSTIGILLGACTPLQTINALVPENTYQRTNDVSFGSSPRNALDIYAPVGAQSKVPVVVFFYGGNWRSGSRKDFKFVGQALASRGILAVVADYRLYPEVRYPAFLDDSAAAVAWVFKNIENFGGDPTQLFVMGHSAGAYNAAMVALDQRWLGQQGLSPSILRGWIGLAGPYEFLPVTNLDAQPVFLYPNTPTDSQPIRYVTAKSPPSLLIAAKSDSLVDPVRNTGGLAEQSRRVGAPVQEVYLGWTTHTILVATLARPLRAMAPTLDLIEKFVKTDGGRRATQP